MKNQVRALIWSITIAQITISLAEGGGQPTNLIVENPSNVFQENISSKEKWNQVKPILIQKTIQNRDVSNQNLAEYDLSGLIFDTINFKSANLSKCNFTGCIFNNCDFSSANLIDTNLTNSKFTACNLNNAHVQGANFSDAQFLGEMPLRMQMVEAIDSKDYGAWFDVNSKSPINIIKQQKELCDKSNSSQNRNLSNYLRNAANTLSDLIACMRFDFSNLNLNGQDFTGYCFRNANFQNSKLQKTELKNTDFRGANLEGIWLQDHEWIWTTKYKGENKQLNFFMRNMRIGDNVWLPNDSNRNIDSLEDIGHNCNDPKVKIIIKNLLLGVNAHRTFNW